MSRMISDDRKLGELILFIARESMADRYMGATKLNKVLYHCDFGAYRDLGSPITGHTYRKLSEGPVPKYLPVIRQELFDDGSAHMEYEDLGAERPLERIVADREPDLSLFSEDEVALVRSVLTRMRTMTGRRASDETHELISWKVAALEEDIPYETAFLGRARQVDVDRGMELAQEHGWG